MVPGRGLEPPRFRRRPLRPLRLPIPPPGRLYYFFLFNQSQRKGTVQAAATNVITSMPTIFAAINSMINSNVINNEDII